MSMYFRTVSLATLLGCSALATAAEPWALTQVLRPPTEAGYQPYEMLGFGGAVAMTGEWLAISMRSGRCELPTGAPADGTVVMYRYDEASGSYAYQYQLCGTGNVQSVAFWNDWMMLGVPARDGVPGDDGTSGVIDFYKLDADGNQWSRVQTVAGTGNAQIGRATAIAGGVAVAGDWTYDDRRGRVFSWRLNASGTQWNAETTMLPPRSPLQPRILPDERFGEFVALDVRGCRAPNCTSPLDALLVQSRSGLHSYERLSAGFGTPTLIQPARGTSSGSMQLSMNAYIAVAGISVTANELNSPCPSAAGQFHAAVRVLERIPGSAALSARAVACPTQLGIESMATWPARSAVTGVKTEFVFSMPDLPAAQIGTVSTWSLFGNPLRARPTDFVVDLNLTPEAYAATGLPHYNPQIVGDYFGIGLAAVERRMAVGATFREGFWGLYGDGYVAIYSR